MTRKVVVGPPIPGPKGSNTVTVNLSFNEPADISGDAVHVKVVLLRHDQESDETTRARASIKARDLINSMSDDIGAGNARDRDDARPKGK